MGWWNVIARAVAHPVKTARSRRRGHDPESAGFVGRIADEDPGHVGQTGAEAREDDPGER